MRYACLVLLFCCISMAMAAAQNTPPGGDQVGSDKHVGRGDLTTRPTNDPETNQRVTNTMGSTSGSTSSPAFAGTGYDNRTDTESPSVAGESGETGAVAARRSDAKRVGTQAGTKSGDNGSVWQNNTTRQSNVVGTSPKQQNASTPERQTSKKKATKAQKP